MATDLYVEGPFEIPFVGAARTKHIGKEHVRQFWNGDGVSHLHNKCGCYVFALRAGRGATPFYVGKAGRGFRQEAMTDPKLVKYNRVLYERTGGTPVIYFVCPPGTKKIVAAADLNHMEKELIQYALLKNSDLTNVQNTKNLPDWTIRGVIRSPQGKPTKAASAFRRMMGI